MLDLLCVPVTSLFEIDRESVDGRKISEYKAWLKNTIELFPNVLVFHDGCLDDEEFPDTKLLRINKDELKIFTFKHKVDQLIRTGYGNRGDITFKIAEYSLIQYAKFELLARAVQLSGAKSALWIDAGISRFFPNYSKMQSLEKNSTKLINSNFDVVVEVDLWNNISIFPPGILGFEPGTCKRVFSGTSFWVNAKSCQKLHELIAEAAEQWLREDRWDNEQIMMRKAFPISDLKILYFPQRKETGTVARQFEGVASRKHQILSALIKKNLL